MSKHSNAFITLASLFIILASVKIASSIISPFLLSVFIAFVSAPLLLWLEKKLNFPKIIAFLLVAILVIGFLTLIGMIIANSMNGFLDSIPSLQEKLTILMSKLSGKLQNYGISFEIKSLSENLNPSQIFTNAGLFLKSTSKLLSNSFLIFLMVAFMLFETHSLDAKLKAISKKRPQNIVAVEIFAKNLNKYLVIKSLSSLATGAIIAFCLTLLGVEYALIWGVIAFLLNFIPTIGSILAAVPVILLSLVEYNLITTLWVAVIFLVTNVVIGSIIEPRFMGKGLGLSTLVVFLSLLVWGWILGIVGMFLAVPLTMSVKIALQTNKDTEWIGLLLSDYSGKK